MSIKNTITRLRGKKVQMKDRQRDKNGKAMYTPRELGDELSARRQKAGTGGGTRKTKSRPKAGEGGGRRRVRTAAQRAALKKAQAASAAARRKK